MNPDRLAEAEKIIERFLPAEEGPQRTVFEAMNYSVRAGGKRLRPILMIAVYRLFGATSGGLCEEVLYHFAASIEYIHTYSLIHDDLPAMDNDMLRRGKPTTHAKYGEAMAILAGDALLNYAYETATAGVLLAGETGGRDGMSRATEALILLLKNAGIYGMVGGQVVDVESEKTGATITKEKLDFIYENKTGALIAAAMGVGAILSGEGQGSDKYDKIMRMAYDIGLAFQIRDDILDETGDEAALGKPIGSDRRNEKATYVTYAGLSASEKEVEMLMSRAKDTLVGFNGDKENTDFLMELFDYLIYRDR